METTQPAITKHKLIDFLSWLVGGVALLLLIRVLGPFSLVANMGNVPVGNEGRAMLEMMCFVAGLSAILVGITHVFTPEFRDEAANLRAPPTHRVERRHHRHARIGVLMIAGFVFSLAGLVMWLLPFDNERKTQSPVLSMIFVATFALMTLLTAAGGFISARRQRLFDRRHVFA